MDLITDTTLQGDIDSLKSRIADAEAQCTGWQMAGLQEKYLEACSMVEALEYQLDQRLAKQARKDRTTPAGKLTEQQFLATSESDYMSATHLAYFRLKLETMRAEILAHAEQAAHELHEEVTVLADPADRATIEEEHKLEECTRERERKGLKAVAQAIARIDSGDYGWCEETGDSIGIARLLARPTASLTVEAQQRLEERQRMFGA